MNTKKTKTAAGINTVVSSPIVITATPASSNGRPFDELLLAYEELKNSGEYDTITEVDIANHLKKKEIIKAHEEHYKIFYSKSDNKYITSVKLQDGTVKRIKRRKKSDLESYLVEFYESGEKISSIYKNWIEVKRRSGSNNASKLVWAWNKYYEGTKFASMWITEISIGDIRDFIEIRCAEMHLNERQAKEMKSVINMIYDYAVEHEIIEVNKARALRNLTHNKDYLEEIEEKPLEKEVFSDSELLAVMNAAIDLCQRYNNTIYLACILNFYIGCRAGELIALKFSDFDFDNMILTLSRSERELHDIGEDGKVHRTGYEIVTHLKKHAKTRTIPITNETAKILNKIKAMNEAAGFGDSEWLFINEKGERKNSLTINKALGRICENSGIIHKSNHKIRKTFISNLFRSKQFGLTEIRDIAGHKDGSLTLRVYGKMTATNAENAMKMAKALSGQKVPAVLNDYQSIQSKTG